MAAGAVARGPMAEAMVRVVVGRMGGRVKDLARALGWSKWEAWGYARRLGYRFRGARA